MASWFPFFEKIGNTAIVSPIHLYYFFTKKIILRPFHVFFDTEKKIKKSNSLPPKRQGTTGVTSCPMRGTCTCVEQTRTTAWKLWRRQYDSNAQQEFYPAPDFKSGLLPVRVCLHGGNGRIWTCGRKFSPDTFLAGRLLIANSDTFPKKWSG